MSIEMSTLVVGNKEYEVVDSTAREGLIKMDVTGVDSTTHIASGGADKDLWNAIVNAGWYDDVLA